MNIAVVESTTLAALSYDGARGLLQLEFRSGAVYSYWSSRAGIRGVVDGALKGQVL